MGWFLLHLPSGDAMKPGSQWRVTQTGGASWGATQAKRGVEKKATRAGEERHHQQQGDAAVAGATPEERKGTVSCAIEMIHIED